MPTLGAPVLSIIGTHLLPLLTARGFEMSVAVAFGAIVGPAQVGARVIELLIGTPKLPSLRPNSIVSHSRDRRPGR